MEQTLNKAYMFGVLTGLFIGLTCWAYTRAHVIELAQKDIIASDVRKAKLVKAINPDFLTTLTQGK
jgi:hypothetical protein